MTHFKLCSMLYHLMDRYIRSTFPRDESAGRDLVWAFLLDHLQVPDPNPSRIPVRPFRRPPYGLN